MGQTAWNSVNTLIASIALVVAVVAAWYARKQVVLIREERQRRAREEQESIEWSARATEVVLRLIVLIPRQTGNGPLYRRIIEENELVGLVEAYLVRHDIGRNRVEARTLSPELLRLPIVRDTIERVEKRFADLRQNSPEIATLASLM